MSYMFLFTFSTAAHFFTGWPLAFLIFSPPLQIHVVLPTKNGTSSLALALRRSFSRWASLACCLFSLYLCLSLSLYSKFLDMTINLRLILKQQNTETIFAFSFRLYWLFSCLCFTRHGWLCDFPPKEHRVAFGLPYLLIELFYIGIPVVRTDGGRSRDYQNFTDR